MSGVQQLLVTPQEKRKNTQTGQKHADLVDSRARQRVPGLLVVKLDGAGIVVDGRKGWLLVLLALLLRGKPQEVEDVILRRGRQGHPLVVDRVVQALVLQVRAEALRRGGVALPRAVRLCVCTKR